MTFATDPDAALVASVAAGSEEALGVLYDRYSAAIYGHARRLLGDPQAAEEIVQETFLALWNRAETYDARLGSAAAWLRSIGRHRVVDRLRSIGRGPRLIAFSDLGFDDDPDDADALDEMLAAGQPAGAGERATGPEEAAISSELRSLIAQALGGMPDHERSVIELAYTQGLTQSEIAERLGWPIGTVKTRTRRALGRLRGVLGEGFADPEWHGPAGGPDPVAATADALGSGDGSR